MIDREQLIRTAWLERGKAQWDRSDKRRPISLSATAETRPVQLGEVSPEYDELIFNLMWTEFEGRPARWIVCEGVVVEAVSGPMPPEGRVPNSDDRPRHIAPLSGGRTDKAQSDHSGSPQLTIFSDSDGVTNWLKQRPIDIAIVFVSRAALRIFPVMIELVGPHRYLESDYLVRVFRALAAARTVSAYPNQQGRLSRDARAALSGLGDLRAPAPVRAAAYAAAAATHEPSVVEHAIVAARYAINAVEAEYPKNELLNALTVDAGLFGERFSAVTVATSKLWPGEIPVSIAEGWRQLKQELLKRNEGWDAWTVWYDELLAGAPLNADLELIRAGLPEDVWNAGAKAVNFALQHSPFDVRSEEVSNSLERLPSPDAIPPQANIATQFAINQDGNLDLADDPPAATTMQAELYVEVRDKAIAFLALGHNQIADMVDPVARFLEAAPAAMAAVSITRLWSRGNSLRRRLKAHDVAISANDPADPAILTHQTAEALRD
ncbi:hypothetical protein [Bradyrhizobium zhanjiangense]|uniref:hypothetical protein n=1 Tax=Bradyrhizobium zhanjiangense TaxID=1325107 RepID=UPI001008E8FF|nr:hypothetical protein [Bradyrhizobium zhanjiangense]